MGAPSLPGHVLLGMLGCIMPKPSRCLPRGAQPGSASGRGHSTHAGHTLRYCRGLTQRLSPGPGREERKGAQQKDWRLGSAGGPGAGARLTAGRSPGS